MSKIGNWIIQQEQLTEMHDRHYNPEANELNEAYDEYRLSRYRDNTGSPDDMVRRDKMRRSDLGSHWARFLEECTE